MLDMYKTCVLPVGVGMREMPWDIRLLFTYYFDGHCFIGRDFCDRLHKSSGSKICAWDVTTINFLENGN